jgi:hypothetical protein
MTDDTVQGTFYVASADEATAVFHDVHTGQVHTLGENPGVEPGEVVEATIEPQPPMDAIWQVVDIAGQRTIAVERSAEPPTQQARELAAEQSVGELTTRERAGEGELHVITVPDEQTEQAAEDVVEDDATVTRAARLGVNRVEVRAEDGVLSVRYLP